MAEITAPCLKLARGGGNCAATGIILPLVVDDGADRCTDYCTQAHVRRRLRIIRLLDDHRPLHVVGTLDDYRRGA